jgi:hypothetical protein
VFREPLASRPVHAGTSGARFKSIPPRDADVPSTLVAAGLAALLAAALLDERDFDARALAVVVAAGVAPDLDAVPDLLVEGLHNAAFHNVWIPLAAGLALWADERRGGRLRARYGGHGVRVAWVALAAYCVAGIALDLFNVESAAVLWPVGEHYYRVVGRVVYSTTEGVLVTLVEPSLGGGPLLPEARGARVGEGGHVPTVLNPTGPNEGATRELVAIESGWQLLVALAGAVVAGGRLAVGTAVGDGRDARTTAEGDD